MHKLFVSLVLGFCLFAVSRADCPAGVIAGGTPAQDIQTVLDVHNGMRQMIMDGSVPNQPKGKNLKTLKWDNVLGQKAQEIANRCKFEHVNVEGTQWSWVGQNLAISWSSGAGSTSNWAGMIQMWFDEHKDFVYPTTSNGVTGHYTQVVWADTEYIGCGFTYYVDESNMYTKLYVCNYGPGGNYVGQAPYELA